MENGEIMAINKKQFIKQMAKNGHTTQLACREYLNLALDTFYKLLREGNEIKLYGILNAKVKKTPERMARNLQTGKECIVPERKRVKIKISQTLHDRLNE